MGRPPARREAGQKASRRTRRRRKLGALRPRRQPVGRPQRSAEGQRFGGTDRGLHGRAGRRPRIRTFRPSVSVAHQVPRRTAAPVGPSASERRSGRRAARLLRQNRNVVRGRLRPRRRAPRRIRRARHPRTVRRTRRARHASRTYGKSPRTSGGYVLHPGRHGPHDRRQRADRRNPAGFRHHLSDIRLGPGRAGRAKAGTANRSGRRRDRLRFRDVVRCHGRAGAKPVRHAEKMPLFHNEPAAARRTDRAQPRRARLVRRLHDARRADDPLVGQGDRNGRPGRNRTATRLHRGDRAGRPGKTARNLHRRTLSMPNVWDTKKKNSGNWISAT